MRCIGAPSVGLCSARSSVPALPGRWGVFESETMVDPARAAPTAKTSGPPCAIHIRHCVSMVGALAPPPRLFIPASLHISPASSNQPHHTQCFLHCAVCTHIVPHLPANIAPAPTPPPPELNPPQRRFC